MSIAANHTLAAIGEAPVSDAAPCGENIRYESVFEELEAELAKQESLNSETVDWKHVSDLSSKILKECIRTSTFFAVVGSPFTSAKC